MRTLEQQIQAYTTAIVEDVAPVGVLGLATLESPASKRRPSTPWLVAAAAAASVILAIGATAALVRSDAGAPGSGLSECSAETTTTSADGEVPECVPPSDEADIARSAAMGLLGEERFAGLWYEDDGQTLTLGYVGERPPLELLPGVDRLVERDMSLQELQKLADSRTAAEGDSGFRWRVRIDEGTVERVAIGQQLPDFGNESFCDDFRAQLSDAGASLWSELTPDQVEEVGDRCGLGPP